jgi:DNA-binding PadR family transcriptional regulator
MKLFPKNALDLIILSILNDNKEGLTGYFLVKAIQAKFPRIRTPGPGTIYPRLKKMAQSGEITEENNLYSITPEGKKKITDTIPGIIEDSLHFMPKMYKVLMQALPIKKQIKYYSDVSFFHSCNCKKEDVNDKKDSQYLNHFYSLDKFLMNDEECAAFPRRSIEQLESFKENLKQLKTKIQMKLEAEIKLIDAKISAIDSRIEKCQIDRKKWKKIKIEEGKF